MREVQPNLSNRQFNRLKWLLDDHDQDLDPEAQRVLRQIVDWDVEVRSYERMTEAIEFEERWSRWAIVGVLIFGYAGAGGLVIGNIVGGVFMFLVVAGIAAGQPSRKVDPKTGKTKDALRKGANPFLIPDEEADALLSKRPQPVGLEVGWCGDHDIARVSLQEPSRFRTWCPGCKREREQRWRREKREEKMRIKLVQQEAVLSDLEGLTPRQFEHIVARAYEIQGFEVEVTPGSGDFGADVVARKGDEALVIEVKKHQNPVGPGVVQRVLGAMHHYDASGAVVVCLGGFTDAAKQVAGSGPVTLMEGPDLADKVSKLDIHEVR